MINGVTADPVNEYGAHLLLLYEVNNLAIKNIFFQRKRIYIDSWHHCKSEMEIIYNQLPNLQVSQIRQDILIAASLCLCLKKYESGARVACLNLQNLEDCNIIESKLWKS